MEIVLVDVNKDDFANEFASVDKIREKNRPTFFLCDNDTLLNLHQQSFRTLPRFLSKMVNKLKPQVIKSEADMCRHWSKGGLDHVPLLIITRSKMIDVGPQIRKRGLLWEYFSIILMDRYLELRIKHLLKVWNWKKTKFSCITNLLCLLIRVGASSKQLKDNAATN